MSWHDGLAAITKKTYDLRAEGEIEFSDLIEEDVSTEELAELWLLFDEWKTAANQAEKILNAELAERMDREDVMFTFGDWQVFRGWKSKSEKCIDTEGFFGWLATQEDPVDTVERIVNPNNVRFGSLPPAVRDTFFKKSRPPKAEKQAVAAPVQVLEDNRQKKKLAS